MLSFIQPVLRPDGQLIGGDPFHCNILRTFQEKEMVLRP
jgi:hypothetical protein